MPAPIHFVELDLFGVYIAPIAAMMVAAYLVLLLLRRVALVTGVLRLVWHPALFQVALYLVLLSAIVLLADSAGMSTLLPAR